MEREERADVGAASVYLQTVSAHRDCGNRVRHYQGGGNYRIRVYDCEEEQGRYRRQQLLSSHTQLPSSMSTAQM